MNWHYENAGRTIGPVTEEEIHAMRANGIIVPQDRVRREDWPDWQHVAEVWPIVTTPLSAGADPDAIAPPVATGPVAGGTCAECGGRDPAMQSIGGLPICWNCEAFAREKMSHGIPLGVGPWRDGDQIVMRRDVPLPPRCVKCAEPATAELQKRLTCHSPALYLLLLLGAVPYAFQFSWRGSFLLPALILGMVPYVIIALLVRRTFTVHLPLCATCGGKRWRNIAISLVSFFAAMGLFIVGGVLLRVQHALALPLIIAGGVLFCFFLFWAVAIQIAVAKRLEERYAWLTRVGRSWLKILPPWPYG